MEGHQPQFLELIHIINQLGESVESGTPYQLDSKTEDAVNLFIQEVLLAFDHGSFNKDYTQNDALPHLKLKSTQTHPSPTSPSFSITKANGQDTVKMASELIEGSAEWKVSPSAPIKIGMDLYSQKWLQIFKKFAVEETAMLVGGPNHAISIFYKNGAYHVYNPNRSNIASFETANKLMPYLGKAFGYS